MMYELMNYHSKIAAIRAYCGKNGLKMTLHQESEQLYYTDGETVFLPMPKPTWDSDKWADWEYGAYHEAGHNRSPTDDIWEVADREKLYGSDMQWYMNIIDDFRQERVHTGEYAGRDHAVNVGRGMHGITMINMIQEKGVPNKTKKDSVSGPLFCWTETLRPEFQPATEGIGSMMYDLLPAEMQGYADKLRAYDSELLSCETAQEELDLIRKLLKEVWDFSDEELAQAEEGVSKSEAQAEKGAKGEGAEAEATASGKGSGEELVDGEQGKAEIRWEDIIPDNHEKWEESHHDITVNYSGYTTPATLEFYVHPDPDIIVPTESARRNVRIEHVTSLANRVRKLLLVHSQKRWQHGTTKGKLSARCLHKIAEDTDDYSIYRQKTSAITLDSAVTLLVDMSGSMGGDKWDHAVNAAYNMYCCLSKLRIPTEIIGFKSSAKDRFYIFKSFAEKLTESKLAARFQSEAPGSSNEDAAALLFSAQRLLQRREPGKHLIVFSDGQPAGYTADSYGNAKAVVRMIERSGKIDLIGIGILDRTVETIYKNHVVIKRASELEDALMKVIQSRFV